METELDDEDPYRCPVCGASHGSGEPCKHLVTCRCDDSDGFECLAPLYFGNGHMGYEFDELYLAITRFGIAWLEADRDRRRELERNASNLEPALRKVFRHVISRLKKSKNVRLAQADVDECRDLDDYADFKILNLAKPLRELFDTFFREQPGAIDPAYWEIAHSPGLTWSGTNYWATDGKKCAAGIKRRVAECAAAIRRLYS